MTQEIQALIEVTRAQTQAENRVADEEAEKNRLERLRLDQEADRLSQEKARLVCEQERTRQLEDVLRVVRQWEPAHHEPTMVLLLGLKQDAQTLLKLSEVIAMRVIGERETHQIIDALTNMAKQGDVRLEVGSHRVEFGDIEGNVQTGDIAGKDIRKKS